MNLINPYLDLPEAFYSKARISKFSKPKLIRFNKELASFLNLELNEGQLTGFFSGQSLPQSLEPVSLCYSGHQFGHFSGRLGDGRAALLGGVVAKDGHTYDIQFKGSGPTHYSRGGDGLSALGPTLREYIVSEAMHHLGVPSTRALAVCATGDLVMREGPTPGGIFTRVARSHLRVGTFEYFASENSRENLELLFNYAAKRHMPEVLKADKPKVAFLKEVSSRQARLVAQWMSLGFIHGVMNTDNTSISGETIDYGPCAFLDEFREDKVFSFIDRYGRYAYNNQPKIMLWNLARLAECLTMILGENETIADLEAVLHNFPNDYQKYWLELFGQKLGIVDPTSSDEILINSFLSYMEQHELDFTESFRNIDELLQGRFENYPETPELHKFVEQWSTRIKPIANTINVLRTSNPIRIPRNHLIERVIENAISGDYSLFNTICEAVASPFEKRDSWSLFSIAPEKEERVQNTFCGT